MTGRTEVAEVRGGEPCALRDFASEAQMTEWLVAELFKQAAAPLFRLIHRVADREG
jgi:hypothetical protein